MAATKDQKPVESKPLEDEAFIEECAKTLIEYYGTLDPNWPTRIRVVMEEKGWSHRQILGNWIGLILDRGQHLDTPAHPLFEPGVKHFFETTCPECETVFKPKIAGQKYCSEPCGLASARRAKIKRDEENARLNQKIQQQQQSEAQRIMNEMGPPPPVR